MGKVFSMADALQRLIPSAQNTKDKITADQLMKEKEAADYFEGLKGEEEKPLVVGDRVHHINWSGYIGTVIFAPQGSSDYRVKWDRGDNDSLGGRRHHERYLRKIVIPYETTDREAAELLVVEKYFSDAKKAKKVAAAGEYFERLKDETAKVKESG